MTSSPATLMTFLVFCVLFTNNPSRIQGFSVNLIPIDQVDKSLFPESLTLEERYQKIADISRARAHRLESATYLSSEEGKQMAEYNKPYTLPSLIATHNSGYFVTSLVVGSRSYTPYLVVDTGSVETWIQCEGCTECFSISQGNFKRNESLSYRPLPCDDPRCYPKLCKDHWCIYDTKYGGSGHFDSYSKGVIGLETFGFQDSKRVVKRFPNTVFGCGLENHQFDWENIGQNNIIAGILGLGFGPRSILCQYMNETKLRMSYCLPSWSALASIHAVLRFGHEAQIGGRFLRTSMIPNISYCAVNVIGISVAGTRLKIDPNFFRMKSDHTGGFILDTGCYQTMLAQTAYNAVRKEIVQFFEKGYGWHPTHPQRGSYDLCYNLPSGNYTFPTMTYHFEGADLFLDGSNIFFKFSNGSLCLVMLPRNDGATSILGSFQQANHRFLFDFRTWTLSFVREVCH